MTIQQALPSELLAYLKAVAEMGAERDFVSVEAWVLAHGKPGISTAASYKGKRGTPKQCYMNAGRMALYNTDLTYVEGFIGRVIPIAHAWCVKADGTIIEPTIRPASPGDPYYGVAFSTDYLADRMVEDRVWGLLYAKGGHNLITGADARPFAPEGI